MIRITVLRFFICKIGYRLSISSMESPVILHIRTVSIPSAFIQTCCLFAPALAGKAKRTAQGASLLEERSVELLYPGMKRLDESIISTSYQESSPSKSTSRRTFFEIIPVKWVFCII